MKKLKIEAFYAFVANDEKGEGLIGMEINGSWIPFVAADEDRINSLRPLAIDIAKRSRRTVRLLKFSERTQVEIIHDAEVLQ